MCGCRSIDYESAWFGEAVTVFIDLRGSGYPDSTYTLISEKEYDKLRGIYHHAGLQKNFEVVIVRIEWGA